MQELDFIETPENVELQRRLAGIGTRFIAGLLDTLILIAIYVVLLLIWLVSTFADVSGDADFLFEAWTWSMAILLLLGFVVYWGYFVFFEMRTNGQSPGKKSQKIRVVKDGGGAITFTDIAIRNLLRVVDGIAGYAVAGICMFVTRKAQRLGDLAAGTVVISEATSEYFARSGSKGDVQWQREASPEALRATGLNPEEYRLLSNYWMRRSQITLDARRQLLLTLVLPILKRHGQAPRDESVAMLEYHLELLMHKAIASEQTKPPAPGSQGVQS